MISFEGFVQEDGSPIYLQILRYIKRGVVAGVIRDGDELPSRRVLSALLGVNPNTVQKACRTLEEEGLLCSFAGSKSLMQLDEEKIRAIRTELVTEDALTAVRALRQMGIGKAEAMALLEQAWQTAEAQDSAPHAKEAEQ
ncbi:MAG: GntR family transcriptional regulator [Oscillospiraceae bacterium]|nr:GntR family transcriptional regulator [Oscillospiraceae bacterium]